MKVVEPWKRETSSTQPTILKFRSLCHQKKEEERREEKRGEGEGKGSERVEEKSRIQERSLAIDIETVNKYTIIQI